jgi:DnaJ-class molecular chaperone
MSYLDRISHLDTADAENGSEYEINEKTRDTCSECKWGLRLSESQALGRCIRCQSEGAFVDTLAWLAIRRERTARAVRARIDQLRMRS